MKSKVLAKEPTSGRVSMVFRSEACCCRVSPDVGCGPLALQGTGCSPHLLRNVPSSSSQDSLSWNYLVLLTLVELMGTERDRRPLTSQEVAAQTRADRDILSPCRCITPGCLQPNVVSCCMPTLLGVSHLYSFRPCPLYLETVRFETKHHVLYK